jgi:hypothetical protein
MEKLCLGSKKTDSGLEIVEFGKQVVGIPVRLREVRDWTLWRGRSPPKREERLHAG